VTEYDSSQVRFEQGHPVAVGDQTLTSPTQIVTTASGTWALYAAGDGALLVHPGGAVAGSADADAERLRGLAGDGGAEDDRAAASALLAFVAGTDDPGRPTPHPASQGPASRPATSSAARAMRPPATPGPRRARPTRARRPPSRPAGPDAGGPAAAWP
jgi:hypothetical protein